jgi:hypothetical protein
MILAAPFALCYSGFIPLTCTYAFLMMIIVLEPCYEVMNYVLSRQFSLHPALRTFLHISYIFILS